MRQLRELFTLHFDQRLPQRQIARSLGVARSTIEPGSDVSASHVNNVLIQPHWRSHDQLIKGQVK